MIKRSDLLALSFYEKSPFTGSEGPMNYRVEKIMSEDGEKKLLQATVWPGPLCFPLADEGAKERKSAAFSEEGMDELVAWMKEKAVTLSGHTSSSEIPDRILPETGS